jgi:hypothetical protein
VTAVTDSSAPSLRRSALTSGFDGVPWPEFWRGRPTLVIPQLPDLHRPIDPAAGWSRPPRLLGGEVQPGWLLDQCGRGISITAPDGALWYEGYPLLARDWRRAATAQRAVLLISGPFAHIAEFAPAASTGALQVLLIAVR